MANAPKTVGCFGWFAQKKNKTIDWPQFCMESEVRWPLLWFSAILNLIQDSIEMLLNG